MQLLVRPLCSSYSVFVLFYYTVMLRAEVCSWCMPLADFACLVELHMYLCLQMLNISSTQVSADFTSRQSKVRARCVRHVCSELIIYRLARWSCSDFKLTPNQMLWFKWCLTYQVLQEHFTESFKHARITSLSIKQRYDSGANVRSSFELEKRPNSTVL